MGEAGNRQGYGEMAYPLWAPSAPGRCNEPSALSGSCRACKAIKGRRRGGNDSLWPRSLAWRSFDIRSKTVAGFFRSRLDGSGIMRIEIVACPARMK
jgi:hypothetical protein